MEQVLLELGLSEGEAKVYLALLKLGSNSVAKIKEETGLHRTTIYDFIEKLLNKGLVSKVVKVNVTIFTAAPPARLFDLVKEKEERLISALPELNKLAQTEKEEIKVDVYRGREGFKTLLNSMLAEAKKDTEKELCALGIDERQFQKSFPFVLESYFKKEQEAGVKERLITRASAPFVFKGPNLHYKYLADEFFGPIPIGISGSKIFIIIWKPSTSIIIENKELAIAMKKHFELLWKIAKEKPKTI